MQFKTFSLKFPIGKFLFIFFILVVIFFSSLCGLYIYYQNISLSDKIAGTYLSDVTSIDYQDNDAIIDKYGKQAHFIFSQRPHYCERLISIERKDKSTVSIHATLTTEKKKELDINYDSAHIKAPISTVLKQEFFNESASLYLYDDNNEEIGYIRLPSHGQSNYTIVLNKLTLFNSEYGFSVKEPYSSHEYKLQNNQKSFDYWQYIITQNLDKKARESKDRLENIIKEIKNRHEYYQSLH